MLFRSVVAVSSVLGLIVGSFLNVLVHRVPLHLSIVTPRSRCPGCEAPIAPRDNVPVLSWLALRGRCRHCGERISARYPLLELGTGMVFGAVAARFGADSALPAFLVVAAGLVALSAIDLEHRTLPNRILYPVGTAAAGLFVIDTLHAATEHGRMRYNCDLHARKIQIKSELLRAITLRSAIKPPHFLAD